MVQSCAEASPAKWHIAHTAWFFESFILREFLPGYKLFNADFPWLFNSYYRSFAQFPEKRLRSSFSRPGLDEVLGYRSHVDEGIEKLLELGPEAEVLKRIELGANHEEQHQELLLTDILHAFYTNPLRPAYRRESGEPGGKDAWRPRSQTRDLGHPSIGTAEIRGVCGWIGRCRDLLETDFAMTTSCRGIVVCWSLLRLATAW